MTAPHVCARCGVPIDLNGPHWVPTSLAPDAPVVCMDCARATGVVGSRAPAPDHPNCRCVSIPPDDGKLECIGGPWDGERRPAPTGLLAVVRTSEPIGFLHWENGQPSLNLAEPAIVGVYRAVRMRHAPGRPLDRVLLWEPREPRP